MKDSGVEWEAQPQLPVRRLHNFIYCPRLFYFQWVENIFQENADTVAGSMTHRNVDKPSKVDNLAELGLPEGAQIRSLKLESEELGLIGVMDIVEGGSEGAEIVDYKKGSARRNAEGERVAKEPDAVQVAAHALLLREHGITAVRGSIYYAADKRHVPVELTEELFAKVRTAIADARTTAARSHCPPPLKGDQRCLYCSAYPICLPNESLSWARGRRLFDDGRQLYFSFAAPTEDPAIEMERGLDDEESVTTQPPRPERDDGEILIVQKPGAQIGQRGDQLVVTVKGEEARKLPGRQVRAIYIYGAVQLTAQAVSTCLELGIDVAYFAPSGRFLGLLRGLPASGVDARKGQYKLFGDEPLRLRLACAVIRAKIHNQRVMLMRNGEPDRRTLDELEKLRDQAAEAGSITSLLGLEGRAAALYFGAFATMLKPKEEMTFDFQRRNKQPPRDPVNALLSLGYSMMAKELAGVCHAVGLDPFFGFMHQPRYGRPALALDLMEEFRPLIADSVAISLVNRAEVGRSDFLYSASGVALNDHGRRAFWESYARRLDTEVSHPRFGYKMAYRRMFEVQARHLWRFVRGEAVGYQGFTTR